MSPEALLTEARRRGVEIWTDGGSLRYRAPSGALTGELREALRAKKGEIMAALAAEAPRCALCGRQKFQIPGRIPRCMVCDGPFPPEGPAAGNQGGSRP